MSEASLNPQDSPLEPSASPMNNPTGSKPMPPATKPAPATGGTRRPTPPAGAAPGKKSLSPAKLAAHRESVKKSSGPNTPAGKAASSRNALKTGIYAQKWLAVTDEERAMANDLLGELRRQFPAQDLLDEVGHELFIQTYMQRWRYFQAYGGMIDARRGQIGRGIALDGENAASLAEIEEREHILTTVLEQLNRTGRLTAGTLTKLQAIFEASAPAAALIAELRRIGAEAAQPAAAGDPAQAQRLAAELAADLDATKATLRAHIAKQEDAAYRQAVLPSDAEATKFLRHDRDTFRKLQRATAAIKRR